MTNDKTREDFEAWAMANKPELLMQFVGGELSAAYRSAFFYWQAATQLSAARIAGLEAEANVCGSGAGCLYKDARIEALEAEVQALSLDADRYQFAIDSTIEYGRMNFKAIYDAWDGDGSFTDQIDAAIEAERGGA